jgi:hypothetical protein
MGVNIDINNISCVTYGSDNNTYDVTYIVKNNIYPKHINKIFFKLNVYFSYPVDTNNIKLVFYLCGGKKIAINIVNNKLSTSISFKKKKNNIINTNYTLTKKIGCVITTNGMNGIYVKQLLQCYKYILPQNSYIILYVNESDDDITLQLKNDFKTDNFNFVYIKDQSINGGLTGTWN